MKILVTGKSGQIGYELERSLQGVGEVIALDRQQMDLADLDQVRATIRNVKPQLIVNAAAYTSVNGAEAECALAMRINAEAPAVMAEEAGRLGAAMIHYSSDYVFDGSKAGAYTEQDQASPVNVYGRTKLAGEQAIQASGSAHLILRTSWIYGMRRNNFLLTIQRLAQERQQLKIVDDQFGAPTWSRTIAAATACAIGQLNAISAERSKSGNGIGSNAWLERSGIYHLTAQGQATWYGFAQAIMAGLYKENRPRIVPIRTCDYPSSAPRPANSVLSCERWINTFGRLPDWETGLRLCLE